MITHATSKRTAKALPQIEATVSLSITAKLMKFTARQDFVVGNCQVKKGDICFAVRSERREGRYYIVKFNNERATYQCSCGANCKAHEHLTTVREYVMNTVVLPAKHETQTPEIVETEAQPEMPQKRAENVENGFVLDVNTKSTAEQWKAIRKADRARQQKWQAEYRAAAEKLKSEAA
jgi:hypothetical protein